MTSSRLELARQFVRLGFGDAIDGEELPFRSLQFLTEEIPTDEAAELVALLGQDSGYLDGPAVAEVVTRFRGRVSRWQFGRESSPLLIAHLPHWTSQREGADRADRRKIPDDENERLVAELDEAFSAVGAAEVTPADGGDRRVRIWWD